MNAASRRERGAVPSARQSSTLSGQDRRRFVRRAHGRPPIGGDGHWRPQRHRCHGWERTPLDRPSAAQRDAIRSRRSSTPRCRRQARSAAPFSDASGLAAGAARRTRIHVAAPAVSSAARGYAPCRGLDAGFGYDRAARAEAFVGSGRAAFSAAAETIAPVLSSAAAARRCAVLGADGGRQVGPRLAFAERRRRQVAPGAPGDLCGGGRKRAILAHRIGRLDLSQMLIIAGRSSSSAAP